MVADPHQGAASASSSASGSTSAASSSRSASKPATVPRSQKRKLRASFTVHGSEDNDREPGTEQPLVKPKKRKANEVQTKPVAPVVEEKRLRKFRPKAPSNFAAVYERATTQRFFVLSRTLCGTSDEPEMLLEITGSTGNVYRVCIARQPTCDCPHARAGNQCKHTIFVMKKVLRAKYEYVYQLALLSSELREIFAGAPDPTESKDGKEDDKNRKAVDGDCPICFEEMDSGPGKEALVWCKAACGQNIHKQCFDMWATTKRQGGASGAGKVTCPYCRSDWDADEDAAKVADIKRGVISKDGYVNVADQLGISTQRDYSTYHRYWSGNPGRYYVRR